MNTAASCAATAVLVHGAFIGTFGWSRVVAGLQASGLPTAVFANPLRGLAHDAAYLESALEQIEGDVVLVGHGYGGAVVTAASDAANVRALVHIAAFVPDAGSSVLGSVAGFPSPPVVDVLCERSYPADGGRAVELTIKPDAFPEVYCADLPAGRAAVLAAGQRPVAAAALNEPLAPGTSRCGLPAWYVVAGSDRVIHPDAQRAAARRIGAVTAEIDCGSHAVALSRPDTVTEMVRAALRAVASRQTGPRDLGTLGQ